MTITYFFKIRRLRGKKKSNKFIENVHLQRHLVHWNFRTPSTWCVNAWCGRLHPLVTNVYNFYFSECELNNSGIISLDLSELSSLYLWGEGHRKGISFLIDIVKCMNGWRYWISSKLFVPTKRDISILRPKRPRGTKKKRSYAKYILSYSAF